MLKANAQKSARRLRFVGLAIAFAYAGGCGAVYQVSHEPAVLAAERGLGGPALAAVFGVPALLGLASFVGRPDLLLAAGVSAFAMTAVPGFYALLLSPLLVAGIMFLIAWRRTMRSPRSLSLVSVAIVPSALAVVALLVLFLAPGSSVACSRSDHGAGCTETTFIRPKTDIVIALAGAAVVSGVALTKGPTKAARATR